MPGNTAKASAAFLIATMLAPAAGLSQDAGACSPFTVYSDASDRSVQYIDLGTEGHSAGDKRIGSRRLIDAEGKEIGQFAWVVTTLDADDEGSRALMRSVLSLPDGNLHLENYLGQRSPAGDTAQVSIKDPDQGIILGGTGTYALARGTYGVTVEGLDLTVQVDIRCD